MLAAETVHKPMYALCILLVLCLHGSLKLPEPLTFTTTLLISVVSMPKFPLLHFRCYDGSPCNKCVNVT